ncbi:hypothetical protein [Corynebacterium mastitidis]|uniref:hypothetical protein n=1 Tax=Corynebacterium mastitidis TaxID=161890 RepID=UPI0012EAB2AD|nr:hypothetical protein [Corynebacterium mastitidis]
MNNEELIKNYCNRDAAGIYQTASDILTDTSSGKMQFPAEESVDSTLSICARIMIISLSMARKGNDEKLWDDIFDLIESLPHAHTAEVIG